MEYTYKNVERKQIKTASGAKCVINIVNLNESYVPTTDYFESFSVVVPKAEVNVRPIMCGIDSIGSVYGFNQPDTWGDGVVLKYNSGSSPVVQVFGIPTSIYDNPDYFNVTNSTLDSCIALTCLFRFASGDYFFNSHPDALMVLGGHRITEFPTSNSYGTWYNPDAYGEYSFGQTGRTGWIQNGINVGNAIMRYAEPEDLDPYSNIDGESDIPGGGSISIPGTPSESATATGIIGLFAPTAYQMQQLADFMWTDFGGSGSTVEDFLQEIVQALKRLTADPLDYILGLNVIPSRGLSVGASSNIRFGFLGSTGVSMPRLASQYFEVDCGSITFDTVCGNTFLDYAPYSKFSLYLPYVGFVDVDPNDFVGHTMGVKYHGDVVSGAVVAYVTKDGSVMYQYSGNCAVNIPLSSDNWGATFSAAVGVAASIITPAALPAALKEGSVGAALEGSGAKRGIASTVASVASNPSLLSPSIRHSGTVAGTAGAMGVQVPFVIREAVAFHSTEKFNTLNGYPSYYYRRLSEVSGFTSVIGVHIEGSSATAEEIAEIEELLIGGVIL